MVKLFEKILGILTRKLITERNGKKSMQGDEIVLIDRSIFWK
jgi:hypothetical protein